MSKAKGASSERFAECRHRTERKERKEGGGIM